MNERINELKSQCIFRETRGTDAFNSYVVDRFDTEKFAELIVQECIGAISEVKESFFKFRLETDDFTEKNKFFAGEDACNQSVRKIETLFGVEE